MIIYSKSLVKNKMADNKNAVKTHFFVYFYILKIYYY